MSDAIRTRLFERSRSLHSTSPGHVTGLEYTARGEAELVNDLDHYPHAYVLGCVMDRQIKAERAWKIPERVKNRLGSFEFGKLRELSQEEVKHLFHEPEALHRFPNTMAEHFYSAVQRIDAEYCGDASAIWSGPVGSATLVRRFLRFDGVGPKIATMAANILVRDFGIELADRHYIDISVDSHVKRVFQRLDLVPKGGVQLRSDVRRARDEQRLPRRIRPRRLGDWPGVVPSGEAELSRVLHERCLSRHRPISPRHVWKGLRLECETSS